MDKQINIHKIRALGKAKVTQAIPTLLNLLGDSINKEDKSEEDNLTINEIKNTLIKFNIVGFYELKKFLNIHFDIELRDIIIGGGFTESSNNLFKEIIDILSQIRHEEVIKYLISLYEYEVLNSYISLALAKMMKNPFMEEVMLQLSEDDIPQKLKELSLDNERWYYKKWYFTETAPFEYVEQKIRNDLFSNPTLVDYIKNQIISFKIGFPILIKSSKNDIEKVWKYFDYSKRNIINIIGEINAKPYLDTKNSIKNLRNDFTVNKTYSNRRIERLKQFINQVSKSFLRFTIFVTSILFLFMNLVILVDIYNFHKKPNTLKNEFANICDKFMLNRISNSIDTIYNLNKPFYESLNKIEELESIEIPLIKSNRIENIRFNLSPEKDINFFSLDSIDILLQFIQKSNIELNGINNINFLSYKNKYYIYPYTLNQKNLSGDIYRNDTSFISVRREQIMDSKETIDALIDYNLNKENVIESILKELQNEAMFISIEAKEIEIILQDSIKNYIQKNNMVVRNKTVQLSDFPSSINIIYDKLDSLRKIQRIINSENNQQSFLIKEYAENLTFPGIINFDSIQNRKNDYLFWTQNPNTIEHLIKYIEAELYFKRLLEYGRSNIKEAIKINSTFWVLSSVHLMKYWKFLLLSSVLHILLWILLYRHYYKSLNKINLTYVVLIPNVMDLIIHNRTKVKYAMLLALLLVVISYVPIIVISLVKDDTFFIFTFLILIIVPLIFLFSTSSFLTSGNFEKNPVCQLLKEFPEGKRLIDKI